MPLIYCLFCLLSAMFILVWTGLNMMQAAWTFDSQWGVLLLCGVTSAISVLLAAWQSSRGGFRPALRGILFAGIYSVLIMTLQFGLRSNLDEDWLVWSILATALCVPLYAGYCVLEQRKRKHHPQDREAPKQGTTGQIPPIFFSNEP